ncbi:hypothetical protein U8527_10525 [Kordia algicida OT-1]|uniref:Uncharacterized protein n=1 Tax=Kordia algicida OT-1 TaxID=391587 RepID=A9DWC7_9FLAO|nr:hypothetical protein [Kordia algicida]EDP96541.1 hypothetical protein KAOT1_03992 [Kordia algicida OT-1]
MESISLGKRLLVAGGILVCGYIAYCILRNREEELKQQEETQDADFIVIVENDRVEDLKKDQSKGTPLKKATDSKAEKATTPLSVIKNRPMKKTVSKTQGQDVKIEDNAKLICSKPLKIENSIKKELKVESEPKVLSPVHDIEVEQPIEVITKTQEKAANDDFPLQLGSKGKRVWNLKVYMLKNHGASGIVTDQYDALTVEHVKRYLKVDTVTKQLYTQLNMEGKPKKKRNATKKKY